MLPTPPPAAALNRRTSTIGQRQPLLKRSLSQSQSLGAGPPKLQQVSRFRGGIREELRKQCDSMLFKMETHWCCECCARTVDLTCSPHCLQVVVQSSFNQNHTEPLPITPSAPSGFAVPAHPQHQASPPPAPSMRQSLSRLWQQQVRILFCNDQQGKAHTQTHMPLPLDACMRE